MSHRSNLCLPRIAVVTLCCIFSSTSTALTNADYSAETEWLTMNATGTRVAARKQVGGEDIVGIVDLVQMKSVGGLNISAINPEKMYFIDDHRLILVATEEKKRISGYSGMHDISTAFAYDARTKAVTQLLKPGHVIYTGQTGLGSIVGLSKDRKFVYMPAHTQKSSEFVSGPVVYSLLKVDLSGEAKPKIISRGDNDVIDYFVSSTGKPLARERFVERTGVYAVEVKEGKKWRTIYSDDSKLRAFSISGVTPDEKSLVLIAEDEDTGFDSCYTMDLATGKVSSKLFSRPDKDISGILIDINRVIHGVAYAGFTPEYQFFDKSQTDRVAAIQAKFGDQRVSLADWTPSFEKVLVYVAGGQSPGDFYLFDEKNKGTFLMSSRRNVAPENIHPIVKTQYKAADGMNIPTLVTIPRGKAAALTDLPAVMMPHGGPESHDVIGFDWMAQAFAEQGFVVIQPQFRGSSGFGAQHLLAGRGEWGKKMQSDLRDAVEHLTKEKIIDKRKLCIVGWSYGGYAALAGAAFDGDFYRCAVSINGVADVTRMLKQEQREENRAFDVYSYWQHVIGNGEVDKAFTDSISPALFADQVEVPVMLIWSNEDKIVLPDQSERMWKALRKAKKPVERLIIKGEGHSFDEAENREKALDSMIDFVKKHTT